MNKWRPRIQNRCGDLLVVDGNGTTSNFLDCSVDLLHRTVRDFLQDCYYEDLLNKLESSNFKPCLSLCRIMLYFLKKQPTTSRYNENNNKTMALVDELLYYAHEVERHDDIEKLALFDVLDQVDQVVGTIVQIGKNHWTHARDSPRARDADRYREGGKCNYLALTIQAGLVMYVRAKITADPRRLIKPGRPLLDYALRPLRITPLMTPYHTQRDEPNISVELVRFLLGFGAEPNQRVFLNDDRSVWSLFLISCAIRTAPGEVNDASRVAWYRASEVMIDHGARPDCFSRADPVGWQTVEDVLRRVFGQDQAAELLKKMREKKREKEIERYASSWTGWLHQRSQQFLGRG